MISKGSRLGVGSLISVRAFDGLRTVSGDLRLFYFSPTSSKKTHPICQQRFAIVPEGRPNEFDSIKAFQEGEEQAYDHYFRLYFWSLCYFATQFLHREDEAEDLVQDCFTKLWQKHFVMDNAEGIRSYLYTTVRNGCLDVLRRKKVREHINGSMDFDIPEIPENSFEEAIIKTEVLNEIYKYIKLLPPKVSEVCRLYYIEGKSDHEISELLQRSYHTVRNQRQKAVALLRAKLNSV